MNNIRIQFDNDLCSIEHLGSGATILTDTPKEYGGEGKSFSSTDLLSASLGACIITSIDKVLIREGIRKESIVIDVTKRLVSNPKRVELLTVMIQTPEILNDKQIKKALNTINLCPVYKCLKRRN